MKGKTVLSGDLKEIKEQYRKKNIFVKGDLTKKDLLDIDGVIDVVEHADEYEVKIENIDVSQRVFKEVSKHKNIMKFVVEEPSLNEIFIAKVGESYDK